MSLNRRDFLGRTAALTTTAMLPTAVFADGTIKLGSILDASGPFDAYGKPMDQAMRMAVSEINEAGGLLGRQVEVTAYDTQSDMALYSQYGQQLTRQDKVDVVHGGILSASREAIRQTMRKTKTLYFYNVLYEGGVCDRNIFINGVTPAQQVEALVPFAMKNSGKKVYILAADYNYGQITARWIQKFVADNGGEVVGTDFFPLDVSDFGSTIAKVQTAAPDLVIAPLVGGAHLSFFRQWAAAGMKDKIALASTTLGVGNEHKVLTPEEGNGIMCAYNYSQELDTPENAQFKEKWAAMFDGDQSMHEIAVSHYHGIKTWAEGVRKAGSLDRMAIIEALETGISIMGPGGKVTVDPKTHHAVLDVHLMQMQDQQMKVIETLPQRQPVDTQAVCDLSANPNDNTQYEIEI
ncbi:transporter substrate-binding protein [Sulfitobacter mediterraneus]|jgi:urea transport system substrate-binding protein|uniref:Urea ABC transporter n=1 Tax=Sulfitobacter mediterraneus TaxID=83219 RepID=A0A061SRT6_9RHOB|nr:ABC transporter substrate-binding protein [Sulfitobacter mediterraneus]KAJ01960.1 urea ABC transporter [Sulfitobacter mediterraneus]MBM1558448.1 transporter substrate-binding protein [Sulfitobacter mediterraneus]MBM1569928.1 transporter substrate-binding protein [Sulfitobacter mediterraneus]MBM1573885.1 transporter substrate-binding protein [Sulfitobacter mediterraneus]MBM1577673.1 transporter substrate-binding protein [Sulfitobacter mediterraneus]